MVKQITYLLVYLFIFLSYFVSPENNIVYNYGQDNFKGQIEKLEGNFVLFYAPWCQFCTNFQHIWEELAEMINTEDSKFAIAQVDCTVHHTLCNENDITGYPTLLYYYKNNFQPVSYQGTRDLPSLTLFLSEVFTMRSEDIYRESLLDEVKIYSGMAYLTDQNIEKFVSKGQHFVMFYAPWCRASQNLAVTWAELAVEYAQNESIQIGKINCMDYLTSCKNFDVKGYPRQLWIVNGKVVSGTTEERTLEEFRTFVNGMALPENHDPDKYIKKKRILPVVRISEDTFDLYMQKDLVFINYYAPWCAHCKQLMQIWYQLGHKYENESNVIIAEVDCTQSEKLCLQEDINNFSTMVLYRSSKLIYQETGSASLESLSQILDEYLANPTTMAPPPMKDEL